MALVKVSPQFVEDQERNVSITVTSPYSLKYTAQGKQLEIDVEPLKKSDDTPYSLCVYLNDIDCWTSDEDEKIDAQERGTIKADLQNALNLMETEAEFE